MMPMVSTTPVGVPDAVQPELITSLAAGTAGYLERMQELKPDLFYVVMVKVIERVFKA